MSPASPALEVQLHSFEACENLLDRCAYLCCVRAERLGGPTGWLRSLDCHWLELLLIRLIDYYQLELADSRQLELSGCR